MKFMGIGGRDVTKPRKWGAHILNRAVKLTR